MQPGRCRSHVARWQDDDGVFAAVAEFERDLLVERTQSGLARAKGEGKTLGRPARLSHKQREDIARRIQAGEPLSALAREFGVDRTMIQRAKKAA